jgi:glycosidase
VGLAQSRKEHKDLSVDGEFEFLDLESQDFLAYRKKNDVSETTVIVNLSKNAGESPVEASRDSSLLTQTHKNCSSSVFAPSEGWVYYM